MVENKPEGIINAGVAGVEARESVKDWMPDSELLTKLPLGPCGEYVVNAGDALVCSPSSDSGAAV